MNNTSYYASHAVAMRWQCSLRAHLRAGNCETWLMRRFLKTMAEVPEIPKLIELAIARGNPYPLDQSGPICERHTSRAKRQEMAHRIDRTRPTRMDQLIARYGQETAEWWEGIRERVCRGESTLTLPQAERDKWWSMLPSRQR